MPAEPSLLTVCGGRTLRSVLELNAGRHPEKTFLVFESAAGEVRHYTYAEVDEQANRAANLLRRLGVDQGDRYNLHLVNSPEFLFLWFGGAKIGAIMVPTNPLSPAPEMAYILAHSGARVSVTQPDLAPTILEARRDAPQVSHLLVTAGADGAAELDNSQASGVIELATALTAEPAVAPEARLAPNDPAAMLYTSGTTSRPKGVLVTHAGYIHCGEVSSRFMRLGPDDRGLIVLPIFHGNGQYYLTMPALIVGSSISLVERFSASRYFQQAARHGCTVGSLFAAPMRMILAQPEQPGERDHRLRLVIFAQNITAEQLETWERRFGAPLRQIYGMTETMGLTVGNPLEEPPRNLTMGRPLLGFTARVVDGQGRDVPVGEVGQLLIGGTPGVSLMQSYFENPEATADALRDGWLWTGDNVRAHQDGFLTFVDRGKDMLKRSGENVASGEVEAAINQHPAVFETAVVGVPDEMRDEAIWAYVILREGATVEPGEIIAWCQSRLSRFKVPERVEVVEALPRTAVGKIQKHLLRARALDEFNLEL